MTRTARVYDTAVRTSLPSTWPFETYQYDIPDIKRCTEKFAPSKLRHVTNGAPFYGIIKLQYARVRRFSSQFITPVEEKVRQTVNDQTS